MAARALLFATTIIATVILPSERVEATPLLDNFPEVRTVDDAATKLDPSLQQSSSPRGDEVGSSPTALLIAGRSIAEAENEETIFKTAEKSNDRIISEEKSDEDDLETAAGTNVLRPLFVYRQQLAYRERIKKAGRRSAPNF